VNPSTGSSRLIWCFSRVAPACMCVHACARCSEVAPHKMMPANKCKQVRTLNNNNNNNNNNNRQRKAENGKAERTTKSNKQGAHLRFLVEDAEQGSTSLHDRPCSMGEEVRIKMHPWVPMLDLDLRADTRSQAFCIRRCTRSKRLTGFELSSMHRQVASSPFGCQVLVLNRNIPSITSSRLRHSSHSSISPDSSLSCKSFQVSPSSRSRNEIFTARKSFAEMNSSS